MGERNGRAVPLYRDEDPAGARLIPGLPLNVRDRVYGDAPPPVRRLRSSHVRRLMDHRRNDGNFSRLLIRWLAALNPFDPIREIRSGNPALLRSLPLHQERVDYGGLHAERPRVQALVFCHVWCCCGASRLHSASIEPDGGCPHIRALRRRWGSLCADQVRQGWRSVLEGVGIQA